MRGKDNRARNKKRRDKREREIDGRDNKGITEEE
jgi:hypothetical protein